jgi:hypothetical protein
MFAYNTVFIPQGSTTPEIIGSWQFNSRAPLTTYTIQAELTPTQPQISNIINSTTILSI